MNTQVFTLAACLGRRMTTTEGAYGTNVTDSYSEKGIVLVDV